MSESSWMTRSYSVSEKVVSLVNVSAKRGSALKSWLLPELGARWSTGWVGMPRAARAARPLLGNLEV